jgi:exopolysaccharide production protein ExoZ
VHQMLERSQLDGLQILRGIAALLVVFHHALEELNPVFQVASANKWLILVGAAGVDIFFVISGFIMVHTTWRRFGRPHAASRFILARIVRIYPLHLFCLSIILIVWLAGVGYRSLPVDAVNLVGSLALLPVGAPLHGVTWTLVHEMIFYVLFSLALLLPSRLVGLTLLGLALFSLTILPWVFGGEPHRYFNSPMMLEFLAGALLAVAFNTRRSMFETSAGLRAAGMLLVLAWICWVSIIFPASGTAGLLSFWRIAGWGLGAVVLVFLFLGSVPQSGYFSVWLRWLGDRSYSLYLTHSFVMMAIAILVTRKLVVNFYAGALLFVVVIILSFLVAAIIYRLIEHPLNQWGKRQLSIKTG